MASSSTENVVLCLPRLSSSLNPHSPALVKQSIPSTIPNSHVLIQVEKFGFSANNITYQALGEHPHFLYFDFHPAPESGDVSPKTHGLVPVWGFGTIVASTHPKISVGERVYGYLAPCRYLLVPVSPSDVNKHAFYVPRPRLPPDRRPYNQILRCATDPQYTPTAIAEDLTMLYRPLFWTSFWCEDWLSLSRYQDATTLLITSASSKTAFCLAYLAGKRRAKDPTTTSLTRIVALTSKSNISFTKRLNLYTEVYEYGAFPSASVFRTKPGEKWMYVDVAGNAELNNKIFTHFAKSDVGDLVGAVGLGITNITPSQADKSAASNFSSTIPTTPGSETDHAPSKSIRELEGFFMVEWLNIRKNQLSLSDIFRRQQTAWAELMTDCVSWVELENVYGGENVKKAYERIAKDGLGPDKGFIWSLWDKGAALELSESKEASKL